MQKLPLAWIDKIFERLHSMFGARWADIWIGADLRIVKDCWSEELGKLTGPQIAEGLRRCKSLNFPPNLGEFYRLCHPPIDPEIAFREAVYGAHARAAGENGEWSHPAIYWAMVDCGVADVLNSTWPNIKTRWTKALEVRQEDAQIPPVPDVPKRLSGPPTERRTVDISVIGAPKKDPRLWAKRIIARIEAKQMEHITESVEQIARTALEEQ